jgi:hypothetical protein
MEVAIGHLTGKYMVGAVKGDEQILERLGHHRGTRQGKRYREGKADQNDGKARGHKSPWSAARQARSGGWAFVQRYHGHVRGAAA